MNRRMPSGFRIAFVFFIPIYFVSSFVFETASSWKMSERELFGMFIDKIKKHVLLLIRY
jgi:hypothetical protein